MKEVINTIQHIIQQYGKEVLLEKRFLNIFNDLYPIRMDREVFSLLSDIVKRGYLKQILKIKKRNLKKEIDSISSSLIRDGHAEKNVRHILCAIIVGAGITTEQDYWETLKGQTCPKQPSSSIDLNFHMIGLNIIPYVCLFLFLAVAVSIPYLYICSLSHLWPFWAITIVISFCGIATIVYYTLIEKKWTSFQKGCFRGLMICLSILLIVLPMLTFGYKECGLFYYWSSNYSGCQTDASSLTTMYSAVAGMLFLKSCFLSTEGSLKNKKQSKKYKTVLGFISAIFCYAICTYTIIAMPYYQKKSEFDSYNIKSKELKQNRQNISKSLSFCGIQLGDEFGRCLSIVRANMNAIEFESGNEATAVIDTTDYSLIVDSVITAKTFWDNQNVIVSLYFNKGINMAIKITGLTQNPLPLFISKYGRPEYFIPRLDYDETLTSKVDNNQFLYKGYDYTSYRYYLGDYICFDDYRWTFKNSIISIRYLGDDSYSSYILYLNRNCEKLYSEYKQYSEKLEQEKRRQDKVKEIRKHQQQQRKAAIEKKREEKNHRKAFNEI